MLMPTWILLVFSFLQSPHGKFGAIAFVSGVTAVRIAQSIIFSFFINAADVTSKTGESGIIASTVQVIVGILLWATALKEVYARDEDDALIAKWMTVITTFTPLKAFGLGVLLVSTSIRAWLFMLSAIGVIERAGLSAVQSAVAFLFYIGGAALLLVAPIVVTLRAPARFDALADWVHSRDRPITVVASLVIGGFFLWSGGSGLIG
jgi:hypothetical protein